MRSSFVIALFLGASAMAQTGEAPPAAPPAAVPAPQEDPATAAQVKKPETPPGTGAAPQRPKSDPLRSLDWRHGPHGLNGEDPNSIKTLEQTPVLPHDRAAMPMPMPLSPSARATMRFGGDEGFLLSRAKFAFGSLLLGDPRPLVEQAAFPFMLEDRKINTPDELYEELTRQLRHKRTDLLTLYGIEILSPADMEKKYGKPPARLSSFPIRGEGKVFLAVANLSGHGAVAAFRQVGNDWRIVGYHD